MASQVSRLRRWFALGAILMVATVAGMYFYARWSLRKAVHDLPAKMRTLIHLETDGLVFNRHTGDASSAGKVVFQTPQASGSAVGIEYVEKTGTMNLLSAVAMTVNRPQPVHLNADHGVITKQPHQVVLTTVHMTREQQEARSDHATFFLREDDTVDHILAEGDVETVLHGRSSSNAETHERSA